MDYAQNLNKNIKRLLELNNLSIRQLAEKTDIAASTLTDGLKSKKSVPIEHAIKIAEYFGYTVESLSKNSFNELIAISAENVDESENELVKKYRLLDQRGQQAVQDTLKRELSYSANHSSTDLSTDFMNTVDRMDDALTNQSTATRKK